MAETLFSGVARSAKATEISGLLAGVACVLLVIAGVSAWFLFSERSSRDLQPIVSVCAPLGAFLGVGVGIWAWQVYENAKLKLTVTRGDAGLRLNLDPNVSIRGPFTCTYGIHKLNAHGTHTRILWCDIWIKTVLQLRLTNEIGLIHSAPEDWPQVEPPINSIPIHSIYSLSGGLPDVLKALTSPT